MMTYYLICTQRLCKKIGKSKQGILRILSIATKENAILFRSLISKLQIMNCFAAIYGDIKIKNS